MTFVARCRDTCDIGVGIAWPAELRLWGGAMEHPFKRPALSARAATADRSSDARNGSRPVARGSPVR